MTTERTVRAVPSDSLLLVVTPAFNERTTVEALIRDATFARGECNGTAMAAAAIHAPSHRVVRDFGGSVLARPS